MKFQNLVEFLKHDKASPPRAGDRELIELGLSVLADRPNARDIPPVLSALWAEIDGEDESAARILAMLRVLIQSGVTYPDTVRPEWVWCLDQGWLYPMEVLIREMERLDFSPLDGFEPQWIVIGQTAGGYMITLDGDRLGVFPTRPWDDDEPDDQLGMRWVTDSFSNLLDQLNAAVAALKFSWIRIDEWESLVQFADMVHGEGEWDLTDSIELE